MTFARPKRINGRVPVLTAEEAVKYIPDESTLCVLGAGGGILEATKLIEALAERYKTTQTPKNIGIISPTGLGDRAERGISPIAQEGLVKWALCGTGVSLRASPNWPNKIRFLPTTTPRASSRRCCALRPPISPAF